MERAVGAGPDDGEEGRPAGGPQDADAELPAHGALGDVGAVVHELVGGGVGEGDALDGLVGCRQRLGEVGSRARDGEDASPGAAGGAGVVDLGAGVVHLDVCGGGLSAVQSPDGHSLGVGFGVALRGADHGGGRDVLLEAHVDGREGAGAACPHDFVEVGLKEGEDHLRFGVAESAVEFEDGRAVGREPVARAKTRR